MLALVLFGCGSERAPVSLAPETHPWKDEGQLVIDGLEEVKRLYKAGNKDAAKVLAERVYTERWEPRLEPAARQMEGVGPAIEVEYAFSLLFLEIEGNGRDLEGRVRTLEESARAVADAAGRRFPPPASAGLPALAPPAADGSRPIVPAVRPNWEASGG